MPIVKHVSVHSTPLSNIEYILNGDKNDEAKYATGLNCSTDPITAYEQFRKTFEYYSHERFYKPELQNLSKSEREKSKVRIHHYIQSFDPRENITPEEAHKIGIEWAQKVFGKNMQVICSTHIDKSHIHNHFAVCPYDLNGKKWLDNMKTLNRARAISDKIALEHGLHIITEPKHRNTKKYNEWLAAKNGMSWKDNLRKDLDNIILRDDVRSIDDLTKKLQEQDYAVKLGKYLSIKAPKQRYAVRSFRLGDGYSVEELAYRINHKEKETSLATIRQYSGVQRDYAICIRQMEISVYRRYPKRVTYQQLMKSADLLTMLCEKNITSAKQLEDKLNNSAEAYQTAFDKKQRLDNQIETVEQIIADGEKYLDLLDKDFLTADEKQIYKKVSYVERKGIENRADLEQRKQNLESLKNELPELDKELEKLKSDRTLYTEMWNTYQHDFIEEDYYEKGMRELEELQQEQAQQDRREQEQEEQKHKTENYR